jgi:hypothetical protein
MVSGAQAGEDGYGEGAPGTVGDRDGVTKFGRDHFGQAGLGYQFALEALSRHASQFRGSAAWFTRDGDKRHSVES